MTTAAILHFVSHIITAVGLLALSVALVMHISEVKKR